MPPPLRLLSQKKENFWHPPEQTAEWEKDEKRDWFQIADFGINVADSIVLSINITPVYCSGHLTINIKLPISNVSAVSWISYQL